MSSKLLVLTVLFFFFGVTPAFANNVVLNEIMANPPSGEKEWIELYNPSLTTNMSGWIIEERTGSDLSGIKQHSLPDFTIQNNGFWIFDFATASLNNSGDIITLKDNLGNTIDTYQYNNSKPNKTYGRQPDGLSWIADLDPTKGSSNGEQPTPTPSPTFTPTPIPSPTPTPTKTPSPTPTPKKTTAPTSSPASTASPAPSPSPESTRTEINYRIASVAGIMASASASATASSSATVEIKDQQQINPLVWIGLIFIFVGIGSIGYIYLKKNAKLHLLFRR